MLAFCLRFFLLLLSFPLYAAWEHRDLKNGLQVFVREDHRAPVVLVDVWYRVGSADEPVGITGISHMLEHMMFQGTKLHPTGQYDALIAERGGRHNAFTTADYTGFFVFANRDALSLILDLESDRMVNLTFDQQLFDNERKVVMEERRMRIEDQPVALFLERFDQEAYGQGPYAHPVIGWAKDIQNYKLDDYKQWYQNWYGPQNAVLMIIGDVKANDVFTMVEEKFGPLKNVGPKKNAIRSSKRTLSEKVQFEMKQRIDVPLLMMGYSVPVLQSAERPYIPYALLLLKAYLGGSNDGLLVRTLVKEKKLAAEVSVSYEATLRLDTQFVLGVIPAKGVSIQILEKHILDTLQDLKSGLISAEDLKRLKVQFKAQFIYRQDDLSHQVEWLGQLLMSNQSYLLADQFLDQIQAVTAEQIQEVVRTFFLEKQLTEGVLVPDIANKAQKGGGKNP